MSKKLKTELQQHADACAKLIGELSKAGWKVDVSFRVTENAYHNGGWDRSGGEHYANVTCEKKVSL